jgi:hypothetical protein
MKSLDATTKKEHSLIKAGGGILLIVGITLVSMRACNGIYSQMEDGISSYIESRLSSPNLYNN